MPVSTTLAQLVEVLSAQPINLSTSALTQLVNDVQTDTRILRPGEVFLALRGENFDGHNFVSRAISLGAIAAIVDDQWENDQLSELPLLRVPHTLNAYQQIARWWRDRFDIPVIGITGSAGKTTTKELIAAVLATRGKVHKTHGNFNNEIGVPKTLLELNPTDEFAVVEMAMRGRGQIAALTQISRPTIGVITNVGTAHIELLGSELAIAEAKCELLAEMSPDSIAVLNYDNSLLMNTAARFWSGKTVTYGLSGGDIQGNLLGSEIIEVAGQQFSLPLLGRHNATNYLAALAVAQVLGIDWSILQKGVIVNMPEGRSQRFSLPNDVLILDETYNAAPEAMVAALQLLADTPGKRKIAVLGAMKELGERSRQLHQMVGETVQKLRLDGLLVLVDGQDAQAIAQSVVDIPCECFATHADLVQRLNNFVQAGDRLLFKAAHSVGLERVVSQFRTEYNM